MRVAITSDGSHHGTRVTGQDGTPIEGVKAINLRMAVDEITTLGVELLFVRVDRVEGEAEMIGPSGKAVRRIEYADGSVDEYPA